MILQSSLEQSGLEKHNLLLDCKVQDIEIVLLLGSLDDIIEVEVLLASDFKYVQLCGTLCRPLSA